MSSINIAIVDEDTLASRLLSDFLQQQDNFVVSIIARDKYSFLKQQKELEKIPDVVLVDFSSEDNKAAKTISTLKAYYSGLKIIALTPYFSTAFFKQIFKLRAHALLLKDIDPKELCEIIQKVYQKGRYFTYNQMLTIYENAPDSQTNTEDINYTPRELEILEFICQQHTSAEIAERLFVSIQTIHAHRNDLFMKTGTRNTIGLIIYALENKLINPNGLIIND